MTGVIVQSRDPDPTLIVFMSFDATFIYVISRPIEALPLSGAAYCCSLLIKISRIDKTDTRPQVETGILQAL